MKKNAFLILLSFWAVTLPACVSLNTVSLTSIPQQRDNPVQAETSRFIFLGFNFNNDYVDDMDLQLRRKCSDGVISGILTKDEIVDYFLMIFYTHRVTATGYCTKAQVARTGMSGVRNPSSAEALGVEGEEAQ